MVPTDISLRAALSEVVMIGLVAPVRHSFIKRSRRFLGRCYSVVSLLGIACLVGCGSSDGSGNATTDRGTVLWAEQGWSEQDRQHWHYLSAGQAFAPLSWYQSLELPGDNGSILNPHYLKKLGFIVEDGSRAGLPIGFAIAPSDSPVANYVGTTCAACHTGQVTFEGRTLRFDGGAFNGDIVTFYGDFMKGLQETLQNDAKWQRFAQSVARLDGTKESVLKAQIQNLLASVGWGYMAYETAPGEDVDAGPGRADALNRIGNYLLGERLKEPSNFHKSNAPANYPHLWGVWKFNWVHYNASFTQPMARNVLQVLGNNGTTNFIDTEGNPTSEDARWKTSINFNAAEDLEKAYAKLLPPPWPEQLLGKVNQGMALQGKDLYEQRCSRCHGPRPIASPDDAKAKLAVSTVPISVIGTDPAHAETFAKRTFDASKLTGSYERISGDQGLMFLTNKIKDYGYDQLGIDAAKRAEMNGFGRENKVRALSAYKARTLDGIWATAPYLHNGSVPNVYELLSPVTERSQVFWTGGYDYDPVKMGYVSSKTDSNTFKLDTAIKGNLNSGHEFSNNQGPGVIGKELSHDQRMAIIEYLKVIDIMPPTSLSPVPYDWEWSAR